MWRILNCKDLQNELYVYQNKVRKDPASFIPLLKVWLTKYKENALQLQNENPLRTFEGPKGVKDAIEFLKTRSQFPN